MIVRRPPQYQRRRTFNISSCFSASVCILLVVVTAFQMYISMHQLHRSSAFLSSTQQQYHHEKRQQNIDDIIIPKRQPEAPRVRDASTTERKIKVEGTNRADSSSTTIEVPHASPSFDSKMSTHPTDDSHHRRVVYLETPDTINTIRTTSTIRTVEPISTHPPKRDDSVRVLTFERPYYRDCTEINDWQISPTCNLLHETESTDLLSTRGSWRTVWNVPNRLILKRLHLSREWNHEAYVRHDTDALAMEKLTSDDYVCDIYASCGPSVLTEAATDSARMYLKNPELSGLDRLELAVQLANALASVHDAKLSHNDLNMANILYVNGTLKLNDFNIGMRLRQYQNGTVCRVPVRFDAPLWKSPEEIRNTSYVDAYAADVYGLGNLLFQILTKRQPWTHLEPTGAMNATEVTQTKLAGGFPTLPNKYVSYSGATIVLAQAVYACFRMERRPSARTIANVLASAARYFRQHPNAHLDLPEDIFDVDESR